MLKYAIFVLCPLGLVAAGEVAHGEVNRDHHQNYRNDDARRDYNHYEDRRLDNNLRRDEGGYNPAIFDGVLINDPYNPDVQYTQPGSTDNFDAVFDQNNR